MGSLGQLTEPIEAVHTTLILEIQCGINLRISAATLILVFFFFFPNLESGFDRRLKPVEISIPASEDVSGISIDTSSHILWIHQFHTARTLLGAPGLTTRSKDATRGSWHLYIFTIVHTMSGTTTATKTTDRDGPEIWAPNLAHRPGRPKNGETRDLKMQPFSER